VCEHGVVVRVESKRLLYLLFVYSKGRAGDSAFRCPMKEANDAFVSACPEAFRTTVHVIHLSHKGRCAALAIEHTVHVSEGEIPLTPLNSSSTTKT